jgi:hypothetical protein
MANRYTLHDLILNDLLGDTQKMGACRSEGCVIGGRRVVSPR